jgi:2-desacetyl-2-hydroxyethyl bacteriochlorophyllide A dehydrogenase
MKSRAIVFTNINETDLVEFEQKSPVDNEVLVKVEVSCVSPGTELRCLAGKEANAGPFPFIPGYAQAGIVLESGKRSVIKPGTRVVSNGTRYADHLKWSWGGHCEYSICHEYELCIIPDNVGFGEASVAVIMGIPMRGARLAAPKENETAVIVGLGLIGNLSARIFQTFGTKVSAFDLSSRRVEIAQAAGIDAHLIVGPLAESAGKVLPNGVDIVVDCTGSPSVPASAMELARRLPWDDSAGKGPRFVFQGTVAGNVSFPYHACFDREMSLIFPRDRRREDIETSLKLLSEGRVKLTQNDVLMVSSEDHQKAYSMLTSPSFEYLTMAFNWK